MRVLCAGDQRFKIRAVQILQTIANGLPLTWRTYGEYNKRFGFELSCL